MTDPDPSPSARVLSVVMPCFNEAATVEESISRVLAQPFVHEVIVVDDCSTDGSGEILAKLDDPRVRVLRHDRNRGKGAALRTGFAAATGRFVGIHDADLEYDPADFALLLAPLLAGHADVVYGSRFVSTEARRVLYFWHSVGNRILTLYSNMLTNLNLTDMETCYKVFRRDVLERITIEEDRFGVEPELTAKVAALEGAHLRGRHQLPRADVRRRQEDRLARRRPGDRRHHPARPPRAGPRRCAASDEPGDVVAGGLRADGADGLEVGEVGVDDGDGVDVVEQLDALALGLAEDEGDDAVLVDDRRGLDVLAAVDDVRRLQALGVQPAQVEREQLLELAGREPGLRRLGDPVGHELDGLVDVVDDAWGDGVEAAGLAADRRRRP